MPASDLELIHRYAHENSGEAFAEIVRRHIDVVYAAAKRQVRSSALAEEVAQCVFVELSRGAARLKPDMPLVAWLHVVTRRTAIDLIRHESRRRAREQTAAELSAMESPTTSWSQIEPHVDHAIAKLNPVDRTAVLLRFFENKSLGEVGASLGVSDDAAQKRVSRALDQLRVFLVRRGIGVTAAGLVADLSAHAMEAAPADLSVSISSTVAAKAAGAVNFVQAAHTVTMTITQKILITTAAALAIGGIFEARIIARQKAELIALRQHVAAIDQELASARAQRDASDDQRKAALAQLEAWRTKAAAAAAVDPAVEAALDEWLQNVVRLRQQLDLRPELKIPELQYLTAKDWLDATKEGALDSDMKIRRALSQLRQSAKFHFMPALQTALATFLKAHHQQPPLDPVQLAPYFDKPVDMAILQRYGTFLTDGIKGSLHVSNADGPARWVIREKSPVDLYAESTLFVTADSCGAAGNSQYDTEVDAAIKTYRAANDDRAPTEPSQLTAYLQSKIDPEFVRDRINGRR